MSKLFKNSPCANCPYRTDAELAFWSVLEFIDLLEKENSPMGVTYGCHKNDGTLCTGWLMKQKESHYPSIMLRMALIKHRVTEEQLDQLKCKSPLYASVIEMCKVNYPQEFEHLHE